jgi:cell volume regulation protein A
MTFTLTTFFALLGGLLVLAFVANRLSGWTRVPDVMVLMAAGIVLGPVLHWLRAAQFAEVTRGFGTLALILILFSAGLEMDLRHALKQFGGGVTLATVSYALTFAGVVYFCTYALGLSRLPSLLVAACFACVSGSIVIPVLEQLRLRPAVKTTLVIEASFGDGLGALGLGVVMDFAVNKGQATSGPLAWILSHLGMALGSHGSIASGVAMMFLFQSLLALAAAVLAGFIWTRLLPLISDKQFWQVLTFAAVLLVYAATHALGGSALLGVIAFGTALANMPNQKAALDYSVFQNFTPDPSHQIHFFHSELAFLVRSFFFVMLGAEVEFGGLRKQFLSALGLLGVFFLARTIAVQFSRIAWRGTTYSERELATLLIPRGLITAVLVLDAIGAQPDGLGFLTSLTFALILLTNVLVLLASIRASRMPAPEGPISEGASSPQGPQESLSS